MTYRESLGTRTCWVGSAYRTLRVWVGEEDGPMSTCGMLNVGCTTSRKDISPAAIVASYEYVHSAKVDGEIFK